MKTKEIVFPCGELRLQGSCWYPDAEGMFPSVTGYSFGDSVALPQACRDPRVRAVARPPQADVRIAAPFTSTSSIFVGVTSPEVTLSP
jgi:hypothetical protein